MRRILVKQKWGQHSVNKINISLLFLVLRAAIIAYIINFIEDWVIYLRTHIWKRQKIRSIQKSRVENLPMIISYQVPIPRWLYIHMSYHTLTTATVSLVKPLVKAVTATIHSLSLFTAPGPHYLVTAPFHLPSLLQYHQPRPVRLLIDYCIYIDRDPTPSRGNQNTGISGMVDLISVKSQPKKLHYYRLRIRTPRDNGWT